MPSRAPPKAPLTSLPDDVQMKHAWQIRAIFQTTRILHLNHVQSGAQNLLKKNCFRSPRRHGQTSVGHFSHSPPLRQVGKKATNLVLVGCCCFLAGDGVLPFSIQKSSSPLLQAGTPVESLDGIVLLFIPSNSSSSSSTYFFFFFFFHGRPVRLVLPPNAPVSRGSSAFSLEVLRACSCDEDKLQLISRLPVHAPSGNTLPTHF